SSSVFDQGVFNCIFGDCLSSARLSSLWNAVLAAAKQLGWTPANTVEFVAFLAHVAHETNYLQVYRENCQQYSACNNYQTSWCSVQATPGQQYYGRGWLQLSYPCNYNDAGTALGLPLLNNPDLVAQSDETASATGIWYWTANGVNVPASKGNFGATTNIINPYECTGHPGQAMQSSRVQTYQAAMNCAGLSTQGANLYC
ncbi:unnamed protein product, partial [Didymodactylos carnosus]